MNRSAYGRWNASFSQHAAMVVVALAVLAHTAPLSAQSPIIAIGPPSFQDTNFPSLETLVLDRLALGGPADPRDLATLAHLTVLESISLWADIQSDVPSSPLGTRLDSQVKQLWDTAAVFEESVSANPPNAQTLPGILPGYRNLQAAAREIESAAAGTAGLSLRVAGHLADLSRLTAATDAMMRVIESDYLDTVAIPAERARSADSLDKQVRLLANGIVALIQNVKNTKHSGSPWGAVTRDLDELFALVQSLEKTLASQPSIEVIEVALRAVRRRMWRVEARIARLGWPSDLLRQWRGVRERLNLISDQLGLPRVIDRLPAAASDQPPATGSSPHPVARIYRGPP